MGTWLQCSRCYNIMLVKGLEYKKSLYNRQEPRNEELKIKSHSKSSKCFCGKEKMTLK